MQGALLRSGKSESFASLGETGQPVYRAALQLREAIRRKHPSLADHLAIPQSDELGNKIDWYSGIQGEVIPWSAATEEERIPARLQLEGLKKALNDLSSRFLGSNPAEQQGDKAVFGKLLKRVIHFPDEDFVYLVNGKPVLTFWGFEHNDAARDNNPLRCLYPPVASLDFTLPPVKEPQPSTLQPVPVAIAHQSWWRRWWWLLPLLLLVLLLLLFGLRSCAPNFSIPALAIPGLPTVDGPKGELPPIEATTLSGTAHNTGVGVPEVSSGTAPSDGMPAPARPANKDEAGLTPPELKASEPENAPAKADEPAKAAELAAPTPPSASAPAAPLSIPPGAADGIADFLNGHYRAGAGIQDRRTGNPLRLEYQFKDGKGEVTVRQPNGVSCSGPVTAAMNKGNLGITSGAQAACGDGSTYDMPKIECAKGAQSIADCTGGYGAEKFPMSMRQMAE